MKKDVLGCGFYCRLSNVMGLVGYLWVNGLVIYYFLPSPNAVIFLNILVYALTYFLSSCLLILGNTLTLPFYYWLCTIFLGCSVVCAGVLFANMLLVNSEPLSYCFLSCGAGNGFDEYTGAGAGTGGIDIGVCFYGSGVCICGAFASVNGGGGGGGGVCCLANILMGGVFVCILLAYPNIFLFAYPDLFTYPPNIFCSPKIDRLLLFSYFLTPYLCSSFFPSSACLTTLTTF